MVCWGGGGHSGIFRKICLNGGWVTANYVRGGGGREGNTNRN